MNSLASLSAAYLLMPEVDGKAFLARMRADEALGDIPVIVVTAMDVEEDLGGLAVGLVGIAQRQGWGVGDSLAALQGLLERAKPRYLSPATESAGVACGQYGLP